MLIQDIKVGARHRHDMGDLAALAASIAEVGLLHPIVIRPDGTLIVGLRRLEACKQLGWKDVPVTVADTADDVLVALKAERDENTCRKDFTPSEAVAMAEAIEPLERKAAKERQERGINQYSEPSEKFSEGSGRALDAVAAAVGMSRPTLNKARAVVEAATQEPEKYGKLLERMERTGKVNSAYKALQEAKREAVREQAAECGREVANITNVRLLVKDIRALSADDIADESVDVVITDPPYSAEYLPLYSDLSGLAARVLKPGGLLVAMSGQSFLPEVYARLSEHLTYWWTACYLAPGASTQLWQRRVLTQWKPLLVYAKEDYNGDWLYDVAKSDAPDKSGHEWGQSISGMDSILARFAQPGMVVLDPFCGAGATGLAAIRRGCGFIGVDINEKSINITKERLHDKA